MKASELKNKGIKFTLGDKEYDLKLNMNCRLSSKFDPFFVKFTFKIDPL